MSEVHTLPEHWQDAEDLLRATPDVYRLHLYGPPSTGKTFAALHCGIDYFPYTVTLTDEMSKHEFLHRPRITNGTMTDEHGPAILAMIEGKRLVINEIDRGSLDCATAILELADDRADAGITLPDGQRVTPAPGFHIVATSNVESDDELPGGRDGALASRFSLSVHLPDPHPAAIARLPEHLRDTAETLCSPRIERERRLTLRAFLSYADAIGAGVPEPTAARAAFGLQAAAILDAIETRRAAGR